MLASSFEVCFSPESW